MSEHLVQLYQWRGVTGATVSRAARSSDPSDLFAQTVTQMYHLFTQRARTKVEAQNIANAEKRFALTMDAWTEVLTLYPTRGLSSEPSMAVGALGRPPGAPPGPPGSA